MTRDENFMPGRRPRLLFAGDIFGDFVFTGVAVPAEGTEVFSEDFAVSAGGVANRSVAAARLGAEVMIASRLGDDFFGRHLRAALEAEPGIDLGLVVEPPGFHTPVTVALASG